MAKAWTAPGRAYFRGRAAPLVRSLKGRPPTRNETLTDNPFVTLVRTLGRNRVSRGRLVWAAPGHISCCCGTQHRLMELAASSDTAAAAAAVCLIQLLPLRRYAAAAAAAAHRCREAVASAPGGGGRYNTGSRLDAAIPRLYPGAAQARLRAAAVARSSSINQTGCGNLQAVSESCRGEAQSCGGMHRQLLHLAHSCCCCCSSCCVWLPQPAPCCPGAAQTRLRAAAAAARRSPINRARAGPASRAAPQGRRPTASGATPLPTWPNPLLAQVSSNRKGKL